MSDAAHLNTVRALERAFDAYDGTRTAELIFRAARQGASSIMKAFHGHPLEDDWLDFAYRALEEHIDSSHGHLYVVANPVNFMLRRWKPLPGAID